MAIVAPRNSKVTKPRLDPAPGSTRPAFQRCRDCGRPHDVIVRCLPDGRWFDADDQTWRDERGRRAAWPDVVEYAGTTDERVLVRQIVVSGDPKARPRVLCRRCQKQREAVGARLRVLSRRALGDLFLGTYDEPSVFERLLRLLGPR